MILTCNRGLIIWLRTSFNNVVKICTLIVIFDINMLSRCLGKKDKEVLQCVESVTILSWSIVWKIFVCWWKLRGDLIERSLRIKGKYAKDIILFAYKICRWQYIQYSATSTNISATFYINNLDTKELIQN